MGQKNRGGREARKPKQKNKQPKDQPSATPASPVSAMTHPAQPPKK